MPSPTEGILFPPPDSSNAFAAEPPRKRSARALLISVRTLKPPRTRHRPPLRAEAATGAAGGPHSEASTRRGGTNVSRECIARSLCRSSTSPAFHWNATLERFMKSPKSSSAANSSSPKGVPSPNTTAFFGSLRESLQPWKAAIIELKNVSLPVESITRAGIAFVSVRSASFSSHCHVVPAARIARSASACVRALNDARHDLPMAEVTSSSAGRMRTYRMPREASFAAKAGCFCRR
mmetsp:Transcript_19094/g.47714  ORF Transcript_19094/g.47714 Transcript_19094/m.47714 type:complete len:236 (-) Transcript_19094:598-1305(-)